MNRGRSLDLGAATSFVEGAIIIDEYDDLIFDDVLRRFVLWDRIDKRAAIGETTGGFTQTDVGGARSAPVRDLGFTATTATRQARPRRNIKAIVADRSFTLFDRSLGIQQNRAFSDLTSKDVADMYTGCLRQWSNLAYEGNASAGAGNEYDGLRRLLAADIQVCPATVSIVNFLDNIIVDMTNTSTRDVMPTAVYTNAKVVQHMVREWESIGNKVMTEQILVNGSPRQTFVIPTSVGMLPLFPDPFNSVIAGTPLVYPTFIVTEDLLSWQYVEPLGEATSEPRTFEIALANDLDQEYKSLMFGALDFLGGTNHHKYVQITDRSTIVSPV